MESLDPETERRMLDDIFDIEKDHKEFRQLMLVCILIVLIIIYGACSFFK